MTYLVGKKVNIRNIKDTHAELISHFEDNDIIEIDVGEVLECDLSLIQLIESARSQGRAVGKKVTLLNNANDAVRATLERSGFAGGLSAEDSIFWFQKEMH